MLCQLLATLFDPLNFPQRLCSKVAFMAMAATEHWYAFNDHQRVALTVATRHMLLLHTRLAAAGANLFKHSKR